MRSLFPRIAVIAAFSIALLFISYKSFTYSSGAPVSVTNAPGEGNCTNCHSGSLNRGAYLSALTLSGDWDGGGYLPDSTYTITVEHSQPGIARYGFEVVVLDNKGKQVGDLSSTGSRTQKNTAAVGGATRQYITHSSTGTSKTGTNKVDWSFEWKAPSSNAGEIVFYVALNAANGNNANSGDTIYAQKFTVKPSSLLPKAEISTNDTNICAFTVAEFKGGGTGSPTAYEWVFSGGSPSVSTSQNPKVNYNNQGNYFARLRVRNAYGLSDWDTVKIVVQPAPSAYIPGGDRKICPGDSVQISVGTGTGLTYLWNTGAITNSIWAKDTGTYYVVVTNRSSCSRVSNEIRVDHFPEPSATLQSGLGSDSICSGQSVALTASGTFDTIFWYANSSLFSKDTFHSKVIRPQASTQYQIRVKDSNQCVSSLSSAVQVKVIERIDAPVLKCSNASQNNVTWEWDPTGHEGYEVSTDSLLWNAPSGGRYVTHHTRQGLSAETDYKLFVRALDVSPCYFSPVSSLVCRTGPCDSLYVELTYPNEVCKGNPVQVEIHGLSGKSYGLYFEGGNVFTDTVFEFTPLISRSYLLEVEDSQSVSCRPARYLIHVQVDEIKGLNLRTQRLNNSFCTYDSIRFVASSGNDLYRFYVNEELRKTTRDSFYYESLFNDGDSAWVEVETGACTAISEIIHLSVIPDPEVDFSYTTEGSIYSFTPDNKNYQSYFWQFGDGFTSVLMEPTHDYVSSANKQMLVNLRVTDNSDCVADTTKILQIPDFASISRFSDGPIRIFPSPVRDLLHLELPGTFEPLNYELIGLRGEKWQSGSISGKQPIIDVRHLASGTYFVRITSLSGEQFVSRFAVE